ncbi:Leucine-specific-binding protein precursor [Methyloligella halotolerans]|uniref:Leucine-specific-binding protein n=1 Tax=Methyloligella halotolerans TaxID=1177755 RepID=A0A1E2RW37_9HYPH|nr:ABC transporter substrate-binding protein [Methyloligella halotolerans]ODA66298.1 Leucine-specific-binding protein precursor [Methyloligella halotolerans]
MTKLSKGGMDRRQFLSTTAAAALLASVSMPKIAFGAEKTVKIGFLAPLTGEVAAWGKPGLDGCHIWADWINADGGVKVGDEMLKVEFVPYDDEYDPSKARAGAVKLIKEEDVKFIMMLGGDPWPGASQVAEREEMLVSTLLPSDLTPDTEMLLAPCEVHPIYNVTGVEWLAENKPDLKTAVICAQDDALGKPSVATYLAAFEAAGIEVLDEPIFFDPATTDFAPIMSKMLALKPDIICLDTCYADYVHPLTEQAFQQGYKGQMISCTADFYQKMVEKTSKEFMEGFIFQFPDFDDPKLNEPHVNFKKPNDFYQEYLKRYGAGEWSAVSWEYASIMDLWADAATKAGTTEPTDVLAAMKEGGVGKHAFGEADWWGEKLFGINNALVGLWPVVAIQDGKAKIQDFKSIPDWWDQHSDLLIKHMKALGQMYYQRT